MPNDTAARSLPLSRILVLVTHMIRRSNVFQSNVGLRAAFLAAAVCLSNQGFTQDFPARTIRVVLITEAGSGTDAHARQLAEGLSAELGQSVIIEPKGGAGGIIGTRIVAQATPNGYTVGFFTPPIVTNLHSVKAPGYKLDDFTVVGGVGQAYHGMLINNVRAPAKNLQEFIAYAKANPGKLNYGSTGPSTTTNILTQRLVAATGINMVEINYKGGAPAGVALLSGEVQLYFNTLAQVAERVQFKQITALAMTGEERVPKYPNLPTFKELGYPTMSNSTWYVVVAPVGMPKPVLQKLQDAVARVRASQKFTDYLAKVEIVPSKSTPDQFTAFMKGESKRVAEDFKRIGIKPQ